MNSCRFVDIRVSPKGILRLLCDIKDEELTSHCLVLYSSSESDLKANAALLITLYAVSSRKQPLALLTSCSAYCLANESLGSFQAHS
jgi:hypothetical protein